MKNTINGNLDTVERERERELHFKEIRNICILNNKLNM